MKKKKSISYAKWGYIFILPFFITFLIFSLIPLVDTVRYSFYEYYRSGIKEIGPNFIGMANYLSLLKSDMFKYSANTDSVGNRICTADRDRTGSGMLVYRCASEDPWTAVFQGCYLSS